MIPSCKSERPYMIRELWKVSDEGGERRRDPNGSR